MPGIVPGTEWAAYYDDLVAEFGLTIEATGPNFGSDALLDTIADTPALATFMGGQTRLVWPAGHGLRRIPVTNPMPVYPHSLLWHAAAGGGFTMRRGRTRSRRSSAACARTPDA
ncbi:hypothetical protein GCM10012289_38100 [Nonomuraea cavernae]|uniref:Uncharacterized protein n=2 Tax=Nonomuraea cavernae TaxID=2045107 RepID=A0A918DM51_9ACTN|nr:hypothetical protein GCM10012289_38100 [Nonomuraea cavernae]